MNIFEIVNKHKDVKLTFAGFDGGHFKYSSEEFHLMVELEPLRLSDCEFASEETIMTLFEQLDYYYDELDFTFEGKYIGGLSNVRFQSIS